jgi:hypothetical protein
MIKDENRKPRYKPATGGSSSNPQQNYTSQELEKN